MVSIFLSNPSGLLRAALAPNLVIAAKASICDYGGIPSNLTLSDRPKACVLSIVLLTGLPNTAMHITQPNCIQNIYI